MWKLEIGLIISVIGLIITVITFHNNSKRSAEGQEKRITKLEDTAENNKNIISELKSEVYNLRDNHAVVIRLETLIEEFGKRQDIMSKKLDKILEKE